ncbi:uncharacterized protein [Hoplias malabaricus]|uniref:uncharacterized protein n=1 Tax=Hoplias malabaricus TaxID=27720 RepID=UPI003462DE02
MATFGKVKYYTAVFGETKWAHVEFMKNLSSDYSRLRRVSTVGECDVILAFCPIVSRTGTDLEEAQQKLNDLSAVKPAVLVVLHHTFNPEIVVPESSRNITRENTLTVDCLFHEDRGLLKCRKNETAIAQTSEHLKLQKPAAAFTHKNYGTVTSQSSVPLLDSTERNGEETEPCCRRCNCCACCAGCCSAICPVFGCLCCCIRSLFPCCVIP